MPEILWKDDFNGAILSPKWQVSNGSWQTWCAYSNPNYLRVHDGMVTLRTERVNNIRYGVEMGTGTNYPVFQYGYAEVRARLSFLNRSENTGMYISLWDSTSKWNEIDFLEISTDTNNQVTFAEHRGQNFSYKLKIVDNVMDWHTYAVGVTRDRLTWYIDGKYVDYLENKFDPNIRWQVRMGIIQNYCQTQTNITKSFDLDYVTIFKSMCDIPIISMRIY